MRTQRRQAVTSAEATAQNYNRLSKSYRNCAPKSSDNLKEEIGELLLYLQALPIQEQQRKYWALFESKLKRYVGLRACGGTV